MGEAKMENTNTALGKRALRQEAARKKRLRKRLITWGIVIVAAAVLVFLGMISAGAVYTWGTAAVVDGEKYSPAEFNYYYYAAFNNEYSSLQESYGDNASLFLNPQEPLDEQHYSSDETWADHLAGEALDSLRSVTAICKEAEAQGYALSEEDQAGLDNMIENVKAAAQAYGFSVNGYLQMIYGEGMTLKTYTRELTRAYTAGCYSDEMNASFLPDNDAIEAAYTADPNAYDGVTFRAFYISGVAKSEIDEETGEAVTRTEEEQKIANTEAMRVAGEQAEAFLLGAHDEAGFIKMCKEFSDEETAADYEDESYGRYEGERYATVKDMSFGDWLFDSARQPGDCDKFEENSGYYIMMYLGREENRYNTVSIRHILIMPETDEATGAATEETMQAAKEKLEGIYDEWKADPTEEHFAELANANSADGDGTTGGLYEDVYRNQMVAEFNDWIFDEARTEGDCGMVQTDYGWHLIYFVGEGEEYRVQLVRSSVQNNAYAEWENGLTEPIDAELRRGVRHAGKFVG